MYHFVKESTIMKSFLSLAISLILLITIHAQDFKSDKESVYKSYSYLVGGTWVAKGTWSSGTEYHQAVTVEFGLNNTLILVKTFDFIDSQKFENSQRNFGIRVYDPGSASVVFTEYDVFGGITKGSVKVSDDSIYLIYDYTNKKGEVLRLIDIWKRVDENTYEMSVCNFTNNEIGKPYLTTLYRREK